MIADVIGSGPYDWTLAFLKLEIAVFGIFEKFKRRHPVLQNYIRVMTWNLVYKAVLYEEGGRTYFQIPYKLRKNRRFH